MNYEEVIKEIKELLKGKLSDEDKCYYIELILKNSEIIV